MLNPNRGTSQIHDLEWITRWKTQNLSLRLSIFNVFTWCPLTKIIWSWFNGRGPAFHLISMILLGKWFTKWSKHLWLWQAMDQVHHCLIISPVYCGSVLEGKFCQSAFPCCIRSEATAKYSYILLFGTFPIRSSPRETFMQMLKFKYFSLTDICWTAPVLKNKHTLMCFLDQGHSENSYILTDNYGSRKFCFPEKRVKFCHSNKISHFQWILTKSRLVQTHTFSSFS